MDRSVRGELVEPGTEESTSQCMTQFALRQAQGERINPRFL